MLTDAVVLVPPEPPAVVQRRDLLLAGGNPWYTALLYGIGDETKVPMHEHCGRAWGHPQFGPRTFHDIRRPLERAGRWTAGNTALYQTATRARQGPCRPAQRGATVVRSRPKSSSLRKTLFV